MNPKSSSSLPRRQPQKQIITLAIVLILALFALTLPRPLDGIDDTPPRLLPDQLDPPETAQDISAREAFESGSWLRPNTRYFVFQSSGGLSNQRIMIENALLLGRALNRTVIIPQLAPHSSMWWNYNKILESDLVPFDILMDRRHAETLTPVVPLRGVTFKRFLLVNENKTGAWKRVERNSLADKRAKPWTLGQILDQFGQERADVLFFAQGTMWEAFVFDQALADEAQRAVRANLALRRAARLAIASKKSPLRPNGFHCLHIRFMDDDGTDLREGLLRPSTSFTWRMRKWNTSLPLYIATVPNKRKSPYFSAFKKKFDVTVFGDVLERDAGVRAVLAAVSKRMRETVLGVVEQLVCARAVKFLGTGFSTFSEMIRRMRRWRVLAVDDGQDLTDVETQTEREWAAVVTPCDKPTWAC